ncbi:hypothetical protein RGUI_3756 [Rhodovulum sp. P5]|uniref:VPLPA-CTERM sorting domain-containing protein n=1 Tax=Rhodovulum sp. P5 TaxID=1564506 RepID=UPI0009C2562A|nr:VPLPA-CTERM sorting domain-containing protein [Rhodovulum sp. P5]ARE41897.1 hypothetical protein RGUI_3756 [Rhodovulum sp. P5]
MKYIKTLLNSTVPSAAVAAGLAIGSGTAAEAASILTQTPQGGYADNIYGGFRWATFTGMIDAQHSVTSVASFDTIGAYDALLVDQELGGSLSGTEIASIQAFVSGGKKAVMFGENSSWTSWNNSLMSVVGGGYSPACNTDVGSTLVANTLTAGVTSVLNGCGSVLNNTGSPTMLFSNGLAALYSVGAGEVLVILDSNWNDDTLYLNDYDNRIFAQNIADWLGEGSVDVPVPASLPLLLLGLGGLYAHARRRSA